ncbi:hypothetical protein FGB62_28g210 [Gracilaria domingensis]|nr:hypothetical protein FGB62_28g210 [Gracilaria domingensis]
MGKVLNGLRTTDVVMEEYALQDVLTAMPEDVVQGALLTLRWLNEEKRVSPIIRKVRLGAMARNELQTVLERLRCCVALEELWFVDAIGGVRMPSEVVRRVQVLSILSPRSRTLRGLREAGCSPKKLQLFCVDDDSAVQLYGVWGDLTRRSETVDVTWSSSLVARYEKCDIQFEGWYLPIDDGQYMNMQIDSDCRYTAFGPQQAFRMYPWTEDGEGRRYGWNPVRLNDWLPSKSWNMNMLREPLPCSNMLGEEGLMTVVVNSYSIGTSLLANDGALLKQFAFEMLSGERRIDKLHVALPRYEMKNGTRHTAKVAAQLVHGFALAGIRELVVSALVFTELAHERLPMTVTSVGVIDDFA